ncbi:hypothetical protein Tco_0832665 [Tanacetum coccineum]
MKSRKRKFTSKDDEELRLCLTIVSNEDKEVDYEILDKKYPIIEWRSEYLTTKPQYQDHTPEGFDKILWGDLIIMFNQSIVIHMLVENKYPLKKEVLSQLLKLKLETEEDNTMALELIRFVKKVFNSPCFMVKSWLVPDQTVPELAIPEQTATGKGIPNPLMAGSLPKTIKPTELDVVVLLKR